MMDQPDTGGRRLRLARRFARQADFAAATSPLSARLCTLLAGWLEGNDNDEVVAWLLHATLSRRSFDVPMLLLAGLHRDVLAGVPEAGDLARYFPTVGGHLPASDPQLAAILRAAILARGATLADFLRTAKVQTNETARGLCWLLPACAIGWPAIHLIELGASAGLNLVADQRHYHLINTAAASFSLGLGKAPDVVVSCEGTCPLRRSDQIPAILSRTGCDLSPCTLDTSQAEQTLSAFIWGDQIQRMTLLRRGIDALHRVNRGPVPVRMHIADLPADLPHFLASRCPGPDGQPIVISNTYLNTYLADKGASLFPSIAAWAASQDRPVLWLQWEPLRDGPEPPHLGWLAWTADLWRAAQHTRWQLAWVHPHGARVIWLRT